MACRRKRPRGAVENNENEGYEETRKEEEVTGYEQSRELRIKENMEKLQKLGIMDLSSKLKSETLRLPRRNPIQKRTPPKPLSLDQSPRRSSRIKSLGPISYSEIHTKEEHSSSKKNEIRIREGTKPEVYTEEHEKLLGDCKTNWTLGLDGYGKNGKRMYDPEKGESCHQCRQKTLGQHTHCSKCKLVQGQFCGDCLYMRYGENVIEANQNPQWICPVCRGICNCSLCRQAQGWVPTGNLYRKVLNLGYKSVAHYLVKTRRAETIIKDSGAECQVAAEESLPACDVKENLCETFVVADEVSEGSVSSP